MATALQLRCDGTGQFRGVWGTVASRSHGTGQFRRNVVATPLPSKPPLPCYRGLHVVSL
jgi:hypothetical protein